MLATAAMHLLLLSNDRKKVGINLFSFTVFVTIATTYVVVLGHGGNLG